MCSDFDRNQVHRLQVTAYEISTATIRGEIVSWVSIKKQERIKAHVFRDAGGNVTNSPTNVDEYSRDP